MSASSSRSGSESMKVVDYIRARSEAVAGMSFPQMGMVGREIVVSVDNDFRVVTRPQPKRQGCPQSRQKRHGDEGRGLTQSCSDRPAVRRSASRHGSARIEPRTMWAGFRGWLTGAAGAPSESRSSTKRHRARTIHQASPARTKPAPQLPAELPVAPVQLSAARQRRSLTSGRTFGEQPLEIDRGEQGCSQHRADEAFGVIREAGQ